MFTKKTPRLAAVLFLTILCAGGQETKAIAEEMPKNLMRFDSYRRMVADAIRHQLITLPYFDVFDWLEAEVLPDGQVVVKGEVVKDTTAVDAIRRVKKIEGVTGTINEIKVLPLSQSDVGLRIDLYRAIYDWNSPLFRYAMRATPPIRIIVQNRRVTLKGVVATQLERRYAYTAARNTPGTLEVKDELQVENTND